MQSCEKIRFFTESGNYMAGNANNLVWLDMEMTGLNPDGDRIIEMAMVVTNSELELVAESPAWVVHQDGCAVCEEQNGHLLPGFHLCHAFPRRPFARLRATEERSGRCLQEVAAAHLSNLTTSSSNVSSKR
jgi:hypothetical protein